MGTALLEGDSMLMAVLLGGYTGGLSSGFRAVKLVALKRIRMISGLRHRSALENSEPTTALKT